MLEERLQCATRTEGTLFSQWRRLWPFRPSQLIGLVIFVEHPHCHPGSLRGVQKRPLVDDEQGLGRGADNEKIKGTGTSLEGGACGLICIDKATVSVCWAVFSCATEIACASYASLSALSFPGRLLLSIQLTVSWFCWNQDDRHRENFFANHGGGIREWW